jgi:hypothetical protein
MLAFKNTHLEVGRKLGENVPTVDAFPPIELVDSNLNLVSQFFVAFEYLQDFAPPTSSGPG